MTNWTIEKDSYGLVASGTLTLNRLDYSIGTGEWSNTKWLSGEIKVDFRATLSGK